MGGIDSLNSLSLSLKFTLELEVDNKLNFLDLTLIKTDNISFNLYRKPTTTDVIIPRDSCQPHKHKLSAIRFPQQSKTCMISTSRINRLKWTQ